jgi:hypothetical protein
MTGGFEALIPRDLRAECSRQEGISVWVHAFFA